jgi:hypothetical protein
VAADPVTDQIPDPSSPVVTPGEGVPSDNTTIVEVMNRYQAAGFDAQFGAIEGGLIHCYVCGTDSEPARVDLVSLRRMEGASEPDDMVAVVALHCPACDAAGVAALGYGPDSAPEDSEVLLRLEDRRGTDPMDVPRDAAPGEVSEGSQTDG